MPVSKELKKGALIVATAVGIFSILTGRWMLATASGVAIVVTSAIPESRKSEAKS